MTNNSDDQNQRTVRAIILCVLVAMVYTQLFLTPQKKPQAPAPGHAATSHNAARATAVPLAPVQPGTPPEVVRAQAPATGHPSRELIAKSPTTFVESDLVKVGLTHLGARIASFKLNEYKLHHGEEEALDMVDALDGAPLPLTVYAGAESDESVQYELTQINGAPATAASANLKVAPGSEVTLEFKGSLPSGNGITKTLTLRDGSYLFSVGVQLERPLPAGQAVWLEWSHYYPATANGSAGANRIALTHLTYLDGFGKVRHVALTDIGQGVRDFGTSKWVSVGDIYFMATLIPTVSGRNTMLGREGDVYVGRVAAAPAGGTFDVYVGPKDYKTLKFVGDYNLERSIDLGWFSFLAYPLLWLLHYLYLLLGNYGLAIIALTLIVKTALLPLSKASFESMRKMQDLQPEIKALKDRIKDSTQLNQEIFALYQRKGVNPMGGCFPIFIQIPVFLGLYQALLNSIELRHAPFALWITDLSAPERLEIAGVGIPVMVLLMAVTMVIQQWTTPTPSADPAQQKMMMIMPVVFAIMFIVFPMPAGLVLYWLVNNLISITPQVYMRNTDRGSVYVGTLFASLGIFGAGYLLTLI